MDCGLLRRPANVSKSRSLKTQRSLKQVEVDAIAEREWPVEAQEYEIVKELGKGAHATVYYAHCKTFDAPVAIKKIDLDSNSHWDLGALERETKLMHKFHHPNVLPLFTSFVAGRELWMVMPVMGQGSVRSIMKRQYPEGLDEVVIATIMYQVLLGLEYVHKNGGIHRDIKADNILLSETGDACLADFGVAATRTRVVSRVNMDLSMVMATTFVGTPCWMAPEVMQQVEGYNSSADIWSFGITLIELATGKPPLARMHPMRVLMDTIRNPPPSLDVAANGRSFSQALHELVDLCLQKDPDDRPSASSLLKHKFFKAMARDPAFLVTNFLHEVRPITPDPAAATAAGRSPAGAVAPATAPSGLGRMPSGATRLKSTWIFPADLAHQAGAGAAGDSSTAVGGGRVPSGPGGAGSFMAAGGPARVRSTWFFPASELQTHAEAHSETDGDDVSEPGSPTAAAAVAIVLQDRSESSGVMGSVTESKALVVVSGSAGGTVAAAEAAVAEAAAASPWCAGSGSVSCNSATSSRGSSVLAAASRFNLAAATVAADSASGTAPCTSSNVKADTAEIEHQQGPVDEADTPCLVEVQVMLASSSQQQQDKSSTKSRPFRSSNSSAGSSRESSGGAARVDDSDRSAPSRQGAKLLKRLSLSLKTLLHRSTSGKQNDLTADDITAAPTADEDYSMFATKPRLARGRPA